MMALCLAREDAVEGWREILGPKEISVAAEQAPDRCSDIYIYNYYNSYHIHYITYSTLLTLKEHNIHISHFFSM